MSCFTGCMAEEAVLEEEAEMEVLEACLELMDLLLQGLLLLLLGCGMAVEQEDDGGGTRVEVVEEGMLVEEVTVTADDGACSVITEGCEVIPSEESLFRCVLALVLSLKPWLRLFPAALMEPL